MRRGSGWCGHRAARRLPGSDVAPPLPRGQPEEPHGAGPGGPGGSTLQQCRQPFLLQLPAWRAAGSLFTARGFRACPGVPASLALTHLALSSSEGEDNLEATECPHPLSGLPPPSAGPGNPPGPPVLPGSLLCVCRLGFQDVPGSGRSRMFQALWSPRGGPSHCAYPRAFGPVNVLLLSARAKSGEHQDRPGRGKRS